MEISPHCLVSLLPFLFLSVFALSLHISLGEFESHPATSRTLLQAKTTCKEDFASKNYTIITSKCKGPNYPAKICCSAFKDFACPFAEALNDEKTDCASTMFSYINLYGRYPPGIFANMCKEGLDCTNVTATSNFSCIDPSWLLNTNIANNSFYLVLPLLKTYNMCYNISDPLYIPLLVSSSIDVKCSIFVHAAH